MPTLTSLDDNWAAKNYPELLQETWDEETFIFNPASGHTHVLNEVATALLQNLAQTPSSSKTLIHDFLPDASAAEQKILIQQLEQLELLGLICRTPPAHSAQ